MPPKERKEEVGSRSASHTHYRRISRAKTAQEARQFFCLAFFGSFPFPNAPFRSQLHLFRTLKVQQGGPQGLAQEVLRTHYRLLDFNPKNSTGPKPKC